MDQIDQVKQKIDIVELISEYIPLKKAGRNFKALCPFHSETEPSFIVSPERQIFKCFGCGVGGNVFTFLMEMEGMEFGEALRTLAKRAGVKLKSYRPSKDDRRKQLFYEINHLTAEFYHYLLTKHKSGQKALEYILNRGITKKLIQEFKLGYAPEMWEGLQKFLVGKKSYETADLEKIGLIIKGKKGFYDRFRNRLMFPLRNHRGNICGFAGRVLQKDVKEAKYVNSPETPIYHKSNLLYGLWLTKTEIKKADRAVLVEGELDAISSYQAGVKNVAAIKGTALTENQLRLLKRYTQSLVLAPDSDVAGDAAARRGIQMADKLGFSIKVVEIEKGKDPDDIAQKSPKLWQKLVKKAVPIYDYFIDSALSRFDVKTAEGKRKVGQELIPILAKITDSLVRGHYIDQLASRIGVAEEAIIAEMRKVSSRDFKKPAIKSDFEIAQKSRQEVLEEYLFVLAFQSNNWARLIKRKTKKLITNPAFLKIAKKVSQYLKEYKKLESDRFAKSLPAELKEIFDNFYLHDLGSWIEDEEKVEKELERTLRGLEREKIKRELAETREQIKKIEKGKGEKKKLKELNKKFSDLLEKLAEF